MNDLAPPPDDDRSPVRSLPHSEGHEKSVLSSLMKFNDLDGMDRITPDLFWQPGRAKIFETLNGRYGHEVDLTSFVKLLDANGDLDYVGGTSAVADIYTYAPNAAHFRSHVEHLYKLRARRLAIEVGTEMVEAAYDESSDEYLELASEPVTRIHDTAAAAQPSLTTRDLVMGALGDYVALAEGKSTPMGISTPWHEFNRVVKGLHGKQVVIISGFPTSGKTVMATNIAGHSAIHEGVPAAVISLEMPAQAVTKRMIVAESGVVAKAFYDPIEHAKDQGNTRPTKHEMTSFKMAAQRINDAPLFIEDPTSPSIAQVASTIRRLHRKHGIKIAVVDYLQLIRGRTGRGMSKEQEVAEISHTFQGLAKELDLTVVLLSQQNKEGGTKYAEAIAEDADLILSIVQDRDIDSDTFGQHLYVFIRKDRHHGETGTKLPLVLNKDRLRFETAPINE